MTQHRLIAMSGRDPHEENRVSTPLELLFDLTFVVAVGIAASQFAHYLAEGHFATALGGFAFAMFGIIWAWINYTWFASAYDTDDWKFRLLTMVQMVGVVILALGLDDIFKSIDGGQVLDNRVAVSGYVVMRLALLSQWARAAREDPARRKTIRAYIITLLVAQAIWIGLIFLDLPIGETFAAMTVPFAIEMAGPFLAESKGEGTPWHGHHIAERYGLFVIIALGEGVVGTVASLSAMVAEQGWSVDAALVAGAGIGLTFGMWWSYFLMPSGTVLHQDRSRSFFWGYVHMVLFAAIAGTGAGLHAAGYYIENKSHIGPVATLLSVAVPVGLFIVSKFVIYAHLSRSSVFTHGAYIALALAIIALAVGLAALGVPMAYALVVLMLAPVMVVVRYETSGHNTMAEDLARLKQRSLH